VTCAVTCTVGLSCSYFCLCLDTLRDLVMHVFVLFVDTLKDLFISDLLLEQAKLKSFDQVSLFTLI